jgi:hypothetical protein
MGFMADIWGEDRICSNKEMNQVRKGYGDELSSNELEIRDIRIRTTFAI